MKIYLVIAFCMLVSGLNGQTGYSFLTKLPELPDNACMMEGEQKELFLEQVNTVIKELDELINKKRRDIKKEAKDVQSLMEKKAASEYGLSDAEVQKLKSKRISKEEKKAIADRMLQEKAGISMKEIEKLKKMSKEGKKQWAESYSTQQMANLSGNPDSNKTQEQLEMEKSLKKNRNTYELVKEQQDILDRIAASDKRYAHRIEELDKEDSVETKSLNNARKPLLKRLMDDPPPASDEIKQIQISILQSEFNYCNKLSPINITILGDALTDLHKFMPEYDKLEKINAEVNKSALGINKDLSSPGLMQLEAVRSYAQKLRLIFKYADYSFPVGRGASQ